MKKGVVCLLSILIGLLVSTNASNIFADTKSQNSSKFDFALLGDTPYDVGVGEKSKSFDKLVKDINRQAELKWVLFAGDMKSGGSRCSDEIFLDRFNRYNQFEKPFIMTIGDNEWTDCHRVSNGQYQPLERLRKLREIFFRVPGTTLGKHKKKVETQSSVSGFDEFPENVRWVENKVMFIVMHIVGSDNALDNFDSSSSAKRTKEDDNEVKRRTKAAISWMEDGFSKAKIQNAAGVFVMIHANPGLDFIIFRRDGFVDFVNALDKQVRDFAKPVVLAHGDTHQFRIDNTALVGSSAPANFTRVETFGKTEKYWIRVSVNPDDPKVFSFKKEKVKKK